MASGDPTANFLNTMGLQGMIGPNPYLEYQGAIPMAGYQGWPTDATGQPIAQPPGMTLNQTPAAPAPQAPAANPGQSAFNDALIKSMGQSMLSNGLMGGQANGGGSGPAYTGFAANPEFGNIIHLQALNKAMQQPSQAASPPAAAANSSGLSRDQYLQLLANPGAPPTYGAQPMPGAAPTGSPPPNVLEQFLAAHPGGGSTGAGGYSNTGFFNTLKQLQGQGAAT